MEWSDGILSNVMRGLAKESEVNEITKTNWIILDGPVDPLWIESMNTTLDDNKLLCLTNGERIPVPPSVRIVFEVADLSNASPATISRVGMIFMGSTLGYKPLLKVSEPELSDA